MSLVFLISKILPIYAIILCGFLLYRYGFFQKGEEKVLLRLLVNIFIPCFILEYLLGNPMVSKFKNLAMFSMSGFLMVAFGFLLSFGIAIILFGRGNTKITSFTFCNGIFNFIFFPVLILKALGFEDLIAVLVAFNAGVELALWSVGMMILKKVRLRHSWQALLNPPLITIMLAITINLLGLGEFSKNLIYGFVHPLGYCSIGLGILLFGIILGEEILVNKIKIWHLKVSIGSVLLRFIVMPTIVLSLIKFLSISKDLKIIIAIQSFMPGAVLSISLSKISKSDISTAIQSVLATSLAGIAMIPVWLYVASKLLNIKL